MTIAEPPNNDDTYLRGDGAWATLLKVADETGVATYNGNTKPGGNTTNGWAAISISGTVYYIPVWTYTT